MIPQLIYLALSMIGLGMEFSKHGDPKKGKHNGYISMTAFAICLVILYYGGFFNVLIK